MSAEPVALLTVRATPAVRLAIAFAGTALSGCTDAPSSTASVADSAGVRIVTHAPGAVASAPEWTLSDRAVTVIGGGADPEQPLYRVTAVQPLPGGRVVVGTNTPARALVFDADGSLAATLGRQGDGPGEFHQVGSVVRIGEDSLGVWDRNRRRLSVFTVDGGHARELDLGGVAPLSPEAAPSTRVTAAHTHLLPLPDRSLVLFATGVWGFDETEPSIVRMELPSHRIDADGSTRATYPAQPGMELYTLGPIPYPFGAGTYAATSADALVVGTADSPEVRFYAADGALAQIVRWEDADRTVAGSPLLAEFHGWLDEQIAKREPAAQTFFRERFEAMPLPERFPAYGGIVSDASSSEIWVGEYPGQLGLMGMSRETRPMPAREWLVFGTAGDLVATVETPERFEPYAVHDDLVWGVFKDELEVESVRAHAIMKR